jgi:hypothetical protein
LGTILGFIIAMTASSWWHFSRLHGKGNVWLGAIIPALVGLTGVFIYGKSEQKKDLANKAQAITRVRP